MARTINMKGAHAQYVEHRAKDATADERVVTMEGEYARYEEHAGTVVPHYPLCGDRETGLRQFEFLVRGGYMSPSTHEEHFLYLMGYSTTQPEGVKPIGWLSTKEQLHRMLQRRFHELLEQNVVTDAELKRLAPDCFVDKNGEGIEIPKPRQENSWMMDQLEKNFPTS